MTADCSGISPSRKCMHFKFLCSPNIAAKYVGQKLTKLSIKRGTATIIIEIISFSKQVICLTKDQCACRSSAQNINKLQINIYVMLSFQMTKISEKGILSKLTYYWVIKHSRILQSVEFIHNMFSNHIGIKR